MRRLVQAETKLGEQSAQIVSLEEELCEAHKRAEDGIVQYVKLNSEKDNLASQMNNLNSRMEVSVKEAEELKERFALIGLLDEFVVLIRA